MAEDLQGASPEGVDPVATSMALAGADRSEANAYLRDQRSHLHEQLKQIHLDIWEKWLGVMLRVATLLVGAGAAGGVSFLVWNAAHSNGLLIEPFSVPPDLAARGLTGQVVAAKLQDRLAAMQAQTNSGRPARSYANSWGEHGIRLDIPETGVSLTELDSFLRDKLGHDAHVSGEIVRKAAGLALSARTGDESAPAVTGQEEDIDAMVQTLAERVYRITQPFRYGMYLAGLGRHADALPIFEALSKGRGKEDRMWGVARWALTAQTLYGNDVALPIIRRGLAENPDNVGMYDVLANFYGAKGRAEEALQTTRTQLAHLHSSSQTYVAAALVPDYEKMLKARIARALGASHEAALAFEELTRTGLRGLPDTYFQSASFGARLGEHDVAAARAVLTEAAGPSPDPRALSNTGTGRMNLALAAEDWRAALATVPANANPSAVAYANAKLGRYDLAEREIASMAGDCYGCLTTRARIADLQGQHARADFWFARAAAVGPSLPFAQETWGRSLLARGKPDDAIAQFKLSNQKGPHFADPLEGWGEALMAKNQSHLALAKFAEADKYAPNWGRLHLKWGEALIWAGKRDEAKAQFARAAQLDLTQSEKAELASMTSS